jgi:hypothetical protein
VLADAFQPLGLEGEDAYRAAARVRMLIAPEEGKARQEELNWDDPDVAWLTGLHDADGHRWFNKESHERMVWWRLLPRLVELAEKDPAGKSTGTSKAFREIEAEAQRATQAAETVGFRLDELLSRESGPQAANAAGEPKTEKLLDPKVIATEAEHEPAGRRN